MTLTDEAAAPAPSSSHDAWRARLELTFSASAHQAGRTVLSSNRHLGPLMVQKALYPEGDAVCHAVVLHPPAGIAAGDELAIDIGVTNNAHALLSTPSATRWYKSSGRLASQHVHLKVAAGAALEWLPEENLFYENVKAAQTLQIELDANARLLAWDGFMLGRSARGEAWQGGEVLLQTQIRRSGQLLYSERGRIKGGDGGFDSAPGLDGFRCGASLYAAGPNTSPELVEQLAASLPYDAELMAGCSEIAPGLMMLRILGREAIAVRQLLHRVWADLRPAVMGLAPSPLRLWAC
jgi:urease accessory protein